jgi:hypothetical protein
MKKLILVVLVSLIVFASCKSSEPTAESSASVLTAEAEQRPATVSDPTGEPAVQQEQPSTIPGVETLQPSAMPDTAQAVPDAADSKGSKGNRSGSVEEKSTPAAAPLQDTAAQPAQNPDFDWDVTVKPSIAYQAFKTSFDFSADLWSFGTYRDGYTSINKRALNITVTKPGVQLFTPSNAIDKNKITDYMLEADVWRVEGDEDGDMGLICRFQDIYHYYAFTISDDGFVRFIKANGRFTYETLLELPYAARSGEPSRLSLACIGTTYALYRDGDLLAAYQDDSYYWGDIGLVAGAKDNPPFTAAFDEVVLNIPKIK